MDFFKQKTHIDFLGIRRTALAFSIFLVLLSASLLLVRGINWGLDFTGGYAIEAHYPLPVSVTDVRQSLEAAKVEGADVVNFGSSSDVRIVLKPKALAAFEGKSPHDQATQVRLKQLVQAALGPQATITQLSFTGPEVGAELAEQGFLALLVAILAISVYITLRFDFKFAVSAAVALAHDPIIILGIFSAFQLPFDLTALAAILAVIGYSLNDTVVIYDRIRENFRMQNTATVTQVVNAAVNDTLSRTTMTSGLTFTVLLVLFLLGGPSIHIFALALMIGVVVGTYSSIYIAGSLSVMLGLSRDAFLQKADDADETV